MKDKQHIDFSQIWKEAHKKQKGEDKNLEDWKSASKKNTNFFDDAQQFYSSGSSFDLNPADSQKSYRRIISILNARQFFRVAGSVAAVLIVALLVFQYINYPNSSVTEVAEGISPGTDKAVLILNNGSQVELSEKKKLNLEEEGAKIKSDGKTLAYHTEKNRKKSKPEIVYNTLKVPRGGQYFLILSDSTRVWLNSESELRYPVNFVGENREVNLVGEAYFEVQRNENKPFFVHSRNQKIRVLGTSFNISAYADEQFIKTTLVEGSVLLEVADKQLKLKPSEQTIYNSESGDVLITKVNPEYFISWKDGNYYFDKESLDVILKTLSRWYDFEYVFEDESAANQTFNGSFNRNQKLENIVLIIEQTQRIKVTAYGKKLVIN